MHGTARATGLTFWIALPLVACLTACSGHGRGAEHDASSRSTETIFSPNGEPLNGGPLGHPSCPDAMTAWFKRVDTNHDQTIELDEYLADARRQFAAMDLNKDGVITPDELATYRAPYDVDMPEAEAPETQDDSGDQGNASGRHGRRGSGETGGGSRGANAANDMADPVMSADADLKFRVTLSDFLSYQAKQFAQLDTRHDQHLTLAEILTLCPHQDSR